MSVAMPSASRSPFAPADGGAEWAAGGFDRHGGQIDRAARLFPDAPLPWLDLSTGISPFAYPDRASPQDTRHLPSQAALERLEGTAAAYFRLGYRDELCAVPGSDLAIRLLGLLMPHRSVRIVAPTYSGYAAAWPHAVEAEFGALAHAELTVLANPNNPDGRIVEPAMLRAHTAPLIVDEAYADAMPSFSLLPDRGGAIVLRSFGKFFGLAGVRLGFVIADRALIERLRALIGDWPLSGHAISIGTRAYADRDWQVKQRERLASASERLDTLLAAQGLSIVGATPLFTLIRADEASALFTHLCRRGILTRPFTRHPDRLRFGLPGDEFEWQRLTSALENWSANR